MDGLALALLALAGRLAVAAWAWGRIPPAADGYYYHVHGVRLAAGEGYTWLSEGGLVSYSAHYPVGYPAWLGAIYALAGTEPGNAMVAQALAGALAALAIHRVLARIGSRRVAALGGLLVALHPGLIGYTPALMTEGVAAALLALDLWLAVVVRERTSSLARLAGQAAIGAAVGALALARPEALLLAPVLALAAEPWRRASRARLCAAAAIGATVALALCVPWMLRNGEHKGRHALSLNGGWNLLIGTEPEARGAYAPLRVPDACSAIGDEGQKDACFARVARARIAADPAGWLALAPRKLGATFDYCGAAGWYLHEASPQAFPRVAKVTLGVVETAYERLALLAAFGWWLPPRPWRGRRRRRLAWLGGAAALSLLSPWAWPGALALAALAARRRTALALVLAGTIAQIAVVHTLFFGAGRYAMPLFPLVSAAAALGIVRAVRIQKLHRETGRQRGGRDKPAPYMA